MDKKRLMELAGIQLNEQTSYATLEVELRLPSEGLTRKEISAIERRIKDVLKSQPDIGRVVSVRAVSYMGEAVEVDPAVDPNE
jgi:hypothetical protein